MSRRKGSKGFSLVELVITVTVLSIVMSMVIGIMNHMSSAASSQRRVQAQQINEEQARLALLSIVRDARLSDSVVAIPGGIEFTAQRAGTGVVTITYTWNTAVVKEATDIYTGTFLLQRDISPATIVVGDGPGQWPNSFSTVPIDDVEIEFFPIPEPPEGYVGFDITIWLNVPDEYGELSPSPTPDDTCSHWWQINSSIAVKRVPTT
jgi:prepilin-type N-terminal cleavage/methylation domain-containing protein